MMIKKGGAGHWFRCTVLAALMPCTSAATAAPAAAPLPADDYARRPAVSHVAVSPSGSHLALVMKGAAGRKQVAVMNLAPLGDAKFVAGFGDADAYNVYWVNNDRLIFQVEDNDAPVDRLGIWSTWAVNRDGSGLRRLISWTHEADTTASSIVSRALPWNWNLHDTVDDESPDVIVRERVFSKRDELRTVRLSRLNTITGERRSLSAGMPEGAMDWVLDGKGQPRVVTTLKEGRATVYWREAGDRPWGAIADFPAYGDQGIWPSFVDAQGQLYVTSRQSRDTDALYRFDPVRKKLDSEPVISLQGFDLDPWPVFDRVQGRLLGLHFRMEHAGSYWFDKDLRQIQLGIDAAMPEGRVNRLWCGRCAEARYFVVESSSDQQPGEYFLFDRQTLQLQRIAASRPWISESSQGRRSFHRVPARDGLPLPVFLTRPSSAAADALLPAVVLVHGGPYKRGPDLRWSEEAQFLASRGYLVVEVSSRGSLGYGLRHQAAGRKQWGQAMQDDLVDAVAWAVKQAGADPKRVCIAGSSNGGYGSYGGYSGHGGYSGYAALMGPIRHPDAYQCAISFAGVTDIDLMYSITWSRLSEDWKTYGMPLLVGDREADAERLASISPLQQVHRIQVPVLLAHGERDFLVPIDHARKFRSAAEKAGVELEWVTYGEEMHGFRQEKNQADYWKRVEAFLARALGPPQAPAAKPAP